MDSSAGTGAAAGAGAVPTGLVAAGAGAVPNAGLAATGAAAGSALLARGGEYWVLSTGY